MTRLLAERMLGRLVTWLRILGFDTEVIERPPLRVPAGAALITRRRALAGRPGVLFLGSDLWPQQLRQVLADLALTPDPGRFLSRCLRCNALVEPIDRATAARLVPDYTLATAESFTRCPSCGKIYWPGSHGQRAAKLLGRILPADPAREET